MSLTSRPDPNTWGGRERCHSGCLLKALAYVSLSTFDSLSGYCQNIIKSDSLPSPTASDTSPREHFGTADTRPGAVRSPSCGLIYDEVTQLTDKPLSVTDPSSVLHRSSRGECKSGQAPPLDRGSQLRVYDSRRPVCAGEGLWRSPGHRCGLGTLPGPKLPNFSVV